MAAKLCQTKPVDRFERETINQVVSVSAFPMMESKNYQPRNGNISHMKCFIAHSSAQSRKSRQASHGHNGTGNLWTSCIFTYSMYISDTWLVGSVLHIQIISNPTDPCICMSRGYGGIWTRLAKRLQWHAVCFSIQDASQSLA